MAFRATTLEDFGALWDASRVTMLGRLRIARLCSANSKVGLRVPIEFGDSEIESRHRFGSDADSIAGSVFVLMVDRREDVCFFAEILQRTQLVTAVHACFCV